MILLDFFLPGIACTAYTWSHVTCIDRVLSKGWLLIQSWASVTATINFNQVHLIRTHTSLRLGHCDEDVETIHTQFLCRFMRNSFYRLVLMFLMFWYSQQSKIRLPWAFPGLQAGQMLVQTSEQGGITCGAIEEASRSSKAIDERVIVNFCDKKAVTERFRDNNDVFNFFTTKCHDISWFVICSIESPSVYIDC